MNQTDEMKVLRLQEERKFINTEFVEGLANQLIDELVRWANIKIFNPRGGELTFDITLGPPNAGVAINPLRPFHPRMEFRLSLLWEIYADAFTFPIVCQRLADETETLKNFNELEQFLDNRVRFTSPLPALHTENVAELFRQVCEAFVERNCEVRSDERQLQPDDVRCRFIMFELMVVWTFFHELGHLVQGHHRMRSLVTSPESNRFFEMEEPAVGDHGRAVMNSTAAPSSAGDAAVPDLAGQARELMADAEAIDLTLKYLVQRGRLNFNVWYLLVCSVGCMFQRFYAQYPDNLELSHARHPHPAIRDEASQLLGVNWVSDYLVASTNVKEREEAAMRLVYLYVRASLMTGLFRSHRIEKRNSPDRLPSYMGLISSGGDQVQAYLRALIPDIERQLPMALAYHLLEFHPLEYWFGYLKARADHVR